MGIDWEGILGEEGYAEVCAYGSLDCLDYGYDTYGSSRCYEDDYDRDEVDCFTEEDDYDCEEDDCFSEEDFDSDDSCEEEHDNKSISNDDKKER